MHFERPQPISVADAIHRLLREEVLSGRQEPGSRIVETKYARRFGVSRTPLREALHKLELEGLVEARPDGMYVQTMDRHLVEEVYEMRQCLEGFAARLAAERISREKLDRLRGIQAAIRAEVRQDPRSDTFVELNSEFHELVARSCGNSRLEHQIAFYRAYWFNRDVVGLYSPAQIDRSLAEHDQLLSALADRDGAIAERTVRKHICNAFAVSRSRFDETTSEFRVATDAEQN